MCIFRYIQACVCVYIYIYTYINKECVWCRGVDAEQNLVLVSVPSVLDASMAPDGCHSLHAYVPATEPYDLWKDLDRNSPEYAKFKEERSQVRAWGCRCGRACFLVARTCILCVYMLCICTCN
jgi:phytoene dehydrogenase-like protein